MRVIEQRRGYFRGTHKGATIEIQRDKTFESEGRKFYIIVKWKDGGTMYDGWSPPLVDTMAEAKREAIAGACLDAHPNSPSDFQAEMKRREEHCP